MAGNNEKTVSGVDTFTALGYNVYNQGRIARERRLPHEPFLCYANVHVRELPLVLFVLRRLTNEIVC